jgi:hypothetical protein
LTKKKNEFFENIFWRLAYTKKFLMAKNGIRQLLLESDNIRSPSSESGLIRPDFSCIGRNPTGLARFGQTPAVLVGIQPKLAEIWLPESGDSGWKASDSGKPFHIRCRSVPKSGDGRLFKHEGRLRRLKNGQLHLPFGENYLRF